MTPYLIFYDTILKNKQKKQSYFNTESLNKLNKAVLTLRALDNPLRHQIIELLTEEPNTNVTKLYLKLRQEQAVVSLHLGILRKAKLVEATKERKNVYYSVNHDKLNHVNEISKVLA